MKLCSVDGCTDVHYAKGYCLNHYMNVRYHGKLTPKSELINKGKRCVVDKCNDWAFCKGYCQKHYRQIYRHGRLTTKTRRVEDEQGI